MEKETIKISESQLRNIIRNVIKESIDEINLYHGTNTDFNKFDTAYMSSGWGQQAHGYGFYLIDDFNAAKDYAYNAHTGQVLEVEVPDGKYLNDKSISMREKERIARIFFKYITKENPDTIDSYPDEQTRQDFWNYEVSYILNCSTGTYVYGTIASLMGSDEDTSNFLHDKCGYTGLIVRDKPTHDSKLMKTYVIFNPNDIKILKKFKNNSNLDESNINRRQTTPANSFEQGTGKFGMFKLSPVLLSTIYEAAFQLLGFERFAINGEIVMDNSIMDNPWDDAYQILKWAIDNKGLNKKYLSKISNKYSNMSEDQFHEYIERVQSGKEFWFTKEELKDIFSHLPHNLQKELIKDMVNVSRINAINNTVEQLKQLNNGETLEQFVNVMREYLKQNPDKRKIKNLKEPVHQAMQSCNMLKD